MSFFTNVLTQLGIGGAAPVNTPAAALPAAAGNIINQIIPILNSAPAQAEGAAIAGLIAQFVAKHDPAVQPQVITQLISLAGQALPLVGQVIDSHHQTSQVPVANPPAAPASPS